MKSKFSSRVSNRIAVCITIGAEAAAASAGAAEKTWDAGGDAFSWTMGANWDLDAAPVANDSLFFGGNNGLAANNDFNADTDFAGITFNADAGAFVIMGNEIDLAAGSGVTNNSPNLQTFEANVDNNGAAKVHNAAAGPITYNAALRANQIIKEGSGTITLSGSVDNPSLGAIVNNGVLALAKSSQRSLGSTVLVNTNGTLRIVGPATDQIHFNQRVIMNGGMLQMENINDAATPPFEEIASLSGSNWNSVVECSLPGLTNRLDIGGGNSHRAIYNGALRDGAGILSFRVYRNNNMQVVNGTNTYSGVTEILNNNGAGVTRLIVNGAHIGGADYVISSSQAAPNGASLGGTGRISAAVMNFNTSAHLSPGGALSADLSDAATFSDTTGILTISNAVNLNTETSTLDIQLNSTAAGAGYDQVVIAGGGSISNNGANLKLALGFTPANGDKFTIVRVQGTDPAANLGAFASLNGVATDLSHGATFVEPSSGKNIRISYRAEGSTFDAGEGNGNDIMLEVVAPAGGQELTWRGSAGDNTWDIGGTPNWRTTGGAAATFANGDFVIFDNSGSNNTPVILASDLTPGTILVDATKNYVFAGPGRLTGTVVMTKTNTGKLSIVTDNDNVGSTIIQRGTIEIGTNGFTGTISGNVSINANGTLAHNRADDVTLAGPFSGSGAFLHTGSGTLTLTADSPFTGHATNSGGVLQLGDGSGNTGSIAGDIHVSGTNVLRYFYGGDVNLFNTKSGNGTVIYEAGSGNRTYLIPGNVTNVNFSGTNIIRDGVRLRTTDNNFGYAIGNGGVVEVTGLGSQVWLDRSATVYNQAFVISGDGFTGDATPLGAIRIFNTTVTGPVTLVGNSRIGGTINGGTISGRVTGDFQLEVLGNANSFVLNLGSTNGANTYGSTLITSGAIRAMTPGAISPGPLTVDAAGELFVNGQTVNVANLNGGPLGSGRILNNSTTDAGTFIVGSDDSSMFFDGVFADGASQPLNVTKVGAGTLTLSAASTNTGVVSVNGGTLALAGGGTFDNASVIAAGAGGTFDVTGAAGTLTLNNGQTLRGSGTVNGNVVALAGATVSPGDGVGTLNINGDLTLGGTLLMELNRGSVPNSDRLNVSGTIAYGSVLTVTNAGPALQVNDVFQLFPSGIAAFTTVNLATSDANGRIYTWQNDISTLGSVRVLSSTAAVNPNPTNIVASASGGSLSLAWPSSHIGWRLQTNAAALSASAWFDYPGATATNNVTIPIDRSKTNVFFRLVHP